MNEQAELFNFEDQFNVDNSPEDLTQVTTTLLYFSEQELKLYKKCAKILMKKYWGDDYKNADVSTLILKIFKNECEIN
jgi:hypothetical protein|tara:strand:- start:2449 stop:2682 length:234 start_codon:yes stop_codon:yes gene_type:complete